MNFSFMYDYYFLVIDSEQIQICTCLLKCVNDDTLVLSHHVFTTVNRNMSKTTLLNNVIMIFMFENISEVFQIGFCQTYMVDVSNNKLYFNINPSYDKD